MFGRSLRFLLALCLTLSFAACSNTKSLATKGTGNLDSGSGSGGNSGGSGSGSSSGSGSGSGGGGLTNQYNYGQQGGIFTGTGGTTNGQTISNAPTDSVQVYQQQSGGSSVIPSIYALSAWRCEAMGDSIGQSDSDGDGFADWDGRFRWAEKCYNGSVAGLPDYRPWLILGRNAYRADGTPLHLYPTFGTINAAGAAVAFRTPITPNANCLTGIQAAIVLLAFCTPGCYSPDQIIQASMGVEGRLASYKDSKEVEIGKAREEGITHIVSLAPGSSLDHLQFYSSKVDYIRDMDAASPRPQPFFTFSMASGKSLRVTPEHPLVDGSGTMRAAKTMEIGDSLLSAEGFADRILKVVREDLPILAHNVTVQSKDPMQSLVIAGGYVNGDLKFQRHEFEWMNRLLDRANIPNEVIDNK